ncbi:hypothetical protein C5167_033850 [Papaver somniferum]|uniref:DUF668 domain-containing protein n=1 Tax=Papaver somniferum TaxID=3469 RepID=A0A4Y7KFM3_PAPSO|nr:uncharacterized protein LOC113295417 [Papaver somniferum]RZC70705.1 hypothetical protein C5167_033850 [Papaver somniferum]
MTWLSDLGNRVGIGIGIKRGNTQKNAFTPLDKNPNLGILAFETARTMSRLLSIYKSLTDEEVLKLRKDLMRSEGILYLNSRDESYLLKLACAERIEDLDRVVIAISRLGKKCYDPGLTKFDYVYADLKFGQIDLGKLEFASKEIDKIIDKMEKFISATSSLYTGLEALHEMEATERKMNQWKNQSTALSSKSNTVIFDQKLSWQRQQVRHLRDVSLWNQTFDKIVGLMARIVCIVYARICVVFGPYHSILPAVAKGKHNRGYSQPIAEYDHKEQQVMISKSGPILKPISKHGLVRFWSRESKPARDENIGLGMGFKENPYIGFSGIGKPSTNLMQQASSTTVGGSGLAMRYANVIILLERYLSSPSSISEYARKYLYQMLPDNLQVRVTTKLKNLLRKEDETDWWDDDSLAQGLKDGLSVILGWLAPMAHNTVKWHTERNFEKQNFDAKPTFLLIQTLYFAEREKVEAAIVEVLVGLSCICRYELMCQYSV